MKITTYKSAVMTNENGRKYRVVHIRFWRFIIDFTFTRLVGNGDSGVQSASSPLTRIT